MTIPGQSFFYSALLFTFVASADPSFEPFSVFLYTSRENRIVVRRGTSFSETEVCAIFNILWNDGPTPHYVEADVTTVNEISKR
jgi:hypothetical protein